MSLLTRLPEPLASSILQGVEVGRYVVVEPKVCRNGHERTPFTTYRWRDRSYCRLCRQEYMAGYEWGERQPYRPTHCPAGHPYDEANTTWEGTRRHCRACKNADSRRRYRERKEQSWT